MKDMDKIKEAINKFLEYFPDLNELVIDDFENPSFIMMCTEEHREIVEDELDHVDDLDVSQTPKKGKKFH